jgi:hypothetical protein
VTRAAVKAGGDEHWFDPGQVDAEVAVVRDAVDRSNSHGRRDGPDRQADHEQHRLARYEAEHVLDHVGPGGGEPVELEVGAAIFDGLYEHRRQLLRGDRPG